MKFQYLQELTRGEFRLTINENQLDRFFFQRDRQDKFLTIAWNRGAAQQITIDGVGYEFPQQSIIPLVVSQSFSFEKPEQIVAWQFNRNFYCVVDHDREVSCVGFIFYGSSGNMFINLDETHQKKIDSLIEVFADEFGTADNIQLDMLQMLLKRLIIIVTRLAKQQFIPANTVSDDKLDIIRSYNLLVENHYRKQHTVAFYAGQLYRSSKTLSNLFALYGHQSPLAIIRERLLLEAKRLLMYTDKSAKEIAYELGYEDAAYFSCNFKKQTGYSPTDFRAAKTALVVQV
ncbi:AraC family transcriptional regulator [Pedobacter sp. Leaf216]|uniref:helix-turn-helix domain-containing protein n=1 Tax=Pedobacter sp. Leaf216 TaxID=1735684 RepID=UPI0006FB669F|nr:AraC family transcriptional regulator [Pedobacter sp. Leaf216]KQM78155.1 AraC family transcriptional regulator [Pedobacter sp. Leaf216]